MLITWGSLSHMMFPVWILNLPWRCTHFKPLIYDLGVLICDIIYDIIHDITKSRVAPWHWILLGFCRKTHQIYFCTELTHLTLFLWFYLFEAFTIFIITNLLSMWHSPSPNVNMSQCCSHLWKLLVSCKCISHNW